MPAGAPSAHGGLDTKGLVVLDLPSSAPVLVFGGPYSNLAATRAVRARAGELGIPPHHVICTGDVVAYCAEPDETARLVRDWGCRVVQGNCEQQLAACAEDCGCGFEQGTTCDLLSKGWYPYASARVGADLRAWMGALPPSLHFRYAGRTFHVIHGGTRDVSRFVFASARDVLADELAATSAEIVVAGHAGLPFIARVGARTWFNPGVVGMPANDGTPDVWYGLIEASTGELRLSTHRLRYDSQSAAGAMRRAGHANGYARALVTGLWPSLDILPPAEREATGKRIARRTVRLARLTAMLSEVAA